MSVEAKRLAQSLAVLDRDQLAAFVDHVDGKTLANALASMTQEKMRDVDRWFSVRDHFPSLPKEQDALVKRLQETPVTKEVMTVVEEKFKDWDHGDVVNHPKHYTFGKFEVIDVVEDWQLDFHLGNAVKYIARHRHKGRPLEDLRKARWYLERAIQNLEKKP